VTDADRRADAWARVQSELPEDAAAHVRKSGYLSRVRVVYARAFTLGLNTKDGELQIDPILLSPPDCETPGDPPPLLPEHYQDVFARDRFTRLGARAQYALGDGWYIVASPPLQSALKVVKKAQAADAETRRNFARNPRAYLADALGDEFDSAFIETLFVETAEFSRRVREVGVWQPKVLPWIAIPKEPWLPPERAGITVDGKAIEIPASEIGGAIARVESAIADKMDSVEICGESVPATLETLDALKSVQQQQTPSTPAPVELTTPERREKKVLIIEDNLSDLGFEVEFAPRPPEALGGLPGNLLTSLKEHQVAGVDWLKKAWCAGRTGVLLADDMGLGKTLQALTFLAWLREGMIKGEIRRAPILVVAPTGLLANWEREHDIHLFGDGLGEPLRAHGQALRDLRVSQGSELQLATPLLNERRLLGADWVLTTFETVRDYQHSFGRIPFAAVVMDEVQKIKTPGTLVTEASKALKADFIIAMTGTPIENRLADLWCIVDTVQPGYLGDLKEFSRAYEQAPDVEKLKQLKARLERPVGPVPSLLLRRTKMDHLDGLPDKVEHVQEEEMPPAQVEAYRNVVMAARAGGRGQMLQALHRLRTVSLHPLEPGSVRDDDYINASARYRQTFHILDQIADKQEKVLIFLEFLDEQPFLASIIQRRYKLASTPMLINGSVTGSTRQERVNRFQEGKDRFDVIILSPRAGGVGITLTAANHVIHLSRWWNPAVEDQCSDRVYRIGQNRPVSLYFPLAVFPDSPEHSFDRRLHALLDRKRKMSRDILCPAIATEQDLQGLFDDTVNVGKE